ncbi:hypothetical protein PFISCL1PPCAC_26669, partial [Pristionchus fissidentatus]
FRMIRCIFILLAIIPPVVLASFMAQIREEVGDALEKRYSWFVGSEAEVADLAIDDIVREYPHLGGSPTKIRGLKVDLLKHATSTPEQQAETLSGGYSELRYLPAFLKKLKVITSKLWDEMSDEDKEEALSIDEPDVYLSYYLRIRPANKVTKKNFASYEERKLTDDEIKEEASATKKRFLDQWFADPNVYGPYDDIEDELEKQEEYERLVNLGVIKEDL